MPPASSLSATRSFLPLCISSNPPKPNPSLSFPFQTLIAPSIRSRAMSSKSLASPDLAEYQDSHETLGGSEGPSRTELILDDSQNDTCGSSGTLLHSSVNEVSTISEEKILIKNNFGETLVGILHETGSKELVIICHGFRSSKESKTIMSLTDTLTRQRISVFRFDFAGNGESEGTFQYGNYKREVDDLRAVILHFSGQKHDVCAIAGHSKGGNVVLLYASVYRDISKVVNISGRFDLVVGVEERLGKDFMQRVRTDGFIDVRDKKGIYRVTEESLLDRLNTDMRSACLSIDQNCRILTIHGSKDETVPVEDSLEFAKHITNHKIQIIEGADHGYQAHQLQLGRVFLDFITLD